MYNHFNSLKDAQHFIIQHAKVKIQQFEEYHGRDVDKESRAWHINAASLNDMFTDEGYWPSDEYAIQALNDAQEKGYIIKNGRGGVMITPLGFQNKDHWY